MGQLFRIRVGLGVIARNRSLIAICSVVSYTGHSIFISCLFFCNGTNPFAGDTVGLFQVTDFLDVICTPTIIVIMSRHQLGYLWPSLTTPPYRPLNLAGHREYISCRHRAAVCRFNLVVLPLLGNVKGSTGVRARPYSSNSALHVWFVSFWLFSWWVVSSRTAAIL